MIIKITTDNKILSEAYPVGTTLGEQNIQLLRLIGDSCSLYEHVMPQRLYELIGNRSNSRSTVSMLVDDNGLYKKLDVNMVASWLYKSEQDGSLIVGNALIVGEKRVADGFRLYCDIPEDIAEKLKCKLEQLALVAQKSLETKPKEKVSKRLW